MAHRRLLLRSQLGVGLAQLRQEEDRVVAKAACALGGEGDSPRADALRLNGIPVGEHAGDGAGEVGGAAGSSPQVGQQQAVTARVVQLRAAVAGGVDPRRAVQGVHAHAGVVGNSGQAAGFHHRLGLQHGVLREGLPSLLHVHAEAQVRL